MVAVKRSVGTARRRDTTEEHTVGTNTLVEF